MRPMRLAIGAKSKPLFYSLISRLDRFSSVISRIDGPPHAKIAFSNQVEGIEQIGPLLAFLDRSGIPLDHIKIEYAQIGEFQLAVSKGLKASGLDFGGDVAERDTGLARYFISTRSYELIRTHRRHIVVGPKGAGKSAILKTLASQADHHALVITPEHYAGEVLNAILKTEHASELQAFITTWKYTLLVEIFKSAVHTSGADARSLAAIRKYLVDRGHLSADLTLFERFVRYLRRIKEVKGSVAGTGVGVGLHDEDELRKLFKMDEILDLVPKLQNVLRRRAFSVFIDELDQSWDNSPNANAFLVSLVMAAIYLNALDLNLHVVIFIRSEIFDLIKNQLGQLDKLRSDIEELSWSRDELSKLIVSRALDSLGVRNDQDLPASEVLKRLFAARMSDSGLDGIGHIISRTSRRPREVIQFCALALSNAIALDASTVDEEAISRAEEAFSRWKREHIISEYLYIYPGLEPLFGRFRGRTVSVGYRELDDVLTTWILESQATPTAPAWLKSVTTPVELLRILYQVELIGVERANTRELDQRRLWEGYDFSYTRPDARPEESPSFLFHPGVWQTFELRR